MPLLKTCLQYIKMNYNFLVNFNMMCSDQICDEWMLVFDRHALIIPHLDCFPLQTKVPGQKVEASYQGGIPWDHGFHRLPSHILPDRAPPSTHHNSNPHIDKPRNRVCDSRPVAVVDARERFPSLHLAAAHIAENWGVRRGFPAGQG